MESLLILHFLATVYMTALIWMVQMVHYPFFHFLDVNTYPQAMKFHQKRMSFCVIPGMFLELFTSLSVLSLPLTLSAPCFILLTLIWISTFFVQVPLHTKLTLKKDERLISKLVVSNWLRTLAWTTRALLLGYFIFTS